MSGIFSSIQYFHFVSYYRCMDVKMLICCLFQVVDEIDGALGDGKGAVEVLLKMVSARCQCRLAF